MMESILCVRTAFITADMYLLQAAAMAATGGGDDSGTCV